MDYLPLRTLNNIRSFVEKKIIYMRLYYKKNILKKKKCMNGMGLVTFESELFYNVIVIMVGSNAK
jgi:hypothetical protein